MLPLRDNIPTTRTAYVTYGLIVVNVLVYFFWQRVGLSLGDPTNLHYQCQLAEWAAVPKEITHGASDALPPQCGTDDANPYLTIFTAMFMHGGLLHLGGNMLFLWIFGDNVEASMGPVRFIVFYLLAGLAATAGQVLIGPDAKVPNICASGAIAGVLAGYLLLFPRARVVTIIFIVFFFTIV